jgi:hypothetical protein
VIRSVAAAIIVALPVVAVLPGAAARGAAPVDGRVAFTVKRGNVESIAVRSLSGPGLRLVSVPPFQGKRVAVTGIAWATGAERFAFSDSAGRVFVVAGGGGGLRHVAGPRQFGRRNLRVSGWSPDGRTVAVETAVRGCTAGEPGLFVVLVDGAGVRRLPARPAGAPAASARHPAFITALGWSPDGSQLLYVWQQYNDGDCRNMGGSDRPTRVLTIGADGKDRRELTRLSQVFGGAWSPRGRLLGLTSRCSGEEALAWRANESALVVTTASDGCRVLVLDRRGSTRADVELWPSSSGAGAVVYAIDAAGGRERSLRKLAAGDYVPIGTMPDERGIVVRIYRRFDAGTRLALLPLDGSVPVALPALRAPKGMTVSYPAAAGFSRR